MCPQLGGDGELRYVHGGSSYPTMESVILKFDVEFELPDGA